jgi:hypothetical protein
LGTSQIVARPELGRFELGDDLALVKTIAFLHENFLDPPA